MAYNRRLKFNINKLYMLMTAEGLTQRELANKIGVSEVTISRWMHGDRVPGATHVLEMSRLFNVKFEELAELIDWTA